MMSPRPAPLVRAVLAAALIVVLLVAAGSDRRRPPSLEARIDQIIADNGARPALWGIYVRDLETDSVLFERNADMPMLPASNQKLLTTAGALRVLGADHRYQTRLLLNGQINGPVLRGDLILKGAGDPTFGSREVDAADPLHAWAEQLSARGVTRIEGRILGDDDVFSDVPYAPGWDVSFLGREDWAPPAGGLSYRDNLVEVRIEANENGSSPSISTDATGYFTIHNKVTTRGRRVPRIDRRLGSNTIVLYGTAPSGYNGTYVLPISDPTAFTLHNFAQALQERGITVNARLLDADDVDEDLAYDEAQELAVYVSPPLREIVPIINAKSNNFYAEHLFRSLGYTGTTDAAARRLLSELNGLGVPTDHLSIYDGSGISRKNLVTPEALGALLAAMHRDSVFVASLPRGGAARTTLQYRLAGLPVQAKTGSLEAVRTLSGYVTTSDGRTLVFAILANHYAPSSFRITRTIDEIVQALHETSPS